MSSKFKNGRLRGGLMFMKSHHKICLCIENQNYLSITLRSNNSI